MNKSEKRLFIIAIVMFVGYLLPFMVWPMVQNIYTDYWHSLDRLEQHIKRYEQLEKRTEYWTLEHQRITQEYNDVKKSLLPGTDQELVGTKMQALVKQLAKDAGITFKSLEPPDTSLNTGDWVLVIQSMQFEAKGQTLMEFLKTLHDTPHLLEIISLDIRSRKKKLTGTIKILGFSRALAIEE
ncbi:MAG: hypothetical protein KAH77_08125 [Thiomargarita sp.]|nr:hypothetical protein [Thiomargarita sp.]